MNSLIVDPLRKNLYTLRHDSGAEGKGKGIVRPWIK
jgi:hypothetical protein